MTEIVVSRRDGVLTAPDGTKHRVTRGKTLADARHPAVVAYPGDWLPMVVELAVDGAPDERAPSGDVDELREQVAELEETLSERYRELGRLAAGLEAAGIKLPADDDREPGWLVDLVLATLARPATRSSEPATAPVIAPPKPRKRAAPPLTTRTGDDG